MPASQTRALWGTTVVLTLLWIGLVGGTAGGAQLVPPGSGLAGPAIALGYGVGAALVAGLLGFLVAWRAPEGVLRTVGIVTVAISLALLALVAWRVVAERAEHGIR